MQLKRVEVINYRSLKKVAVDSLNQVNMLYGHNNTGKSNLLRFIEVVFCRKIRPTFVKFAEHEIGEKVVTGEPSGWWQGEFDHKAFMFTDDEKEVAITFAIDMEIADSELGELGNTLDADYLAKHHGTAHIRFDGTIRSVTNVDSEISLTKVQINRKTAYNSLAVGKSQRYFPSSESLLGQEETLNSLLAIFNDCVLFLGSDRYLTEEAEVSKMPSSFQAQNAKNWLFGYYMDSQKYSKFEDFIAFVKAYRSEHTKEDAAKSAWAHWPFSIGDVGFGRFGQNIDIMLRNPKGRFPVSSYGTGVQQILYLLAKLFFNPAPIFLIEEIELNLSPTAQRELFINLRRLLADKHLNQVLFTTHSDQFISRADFGIYEVVLDNNGYTSINRKRAAAKPFFKRLAID